MIGARGLFRDGGSSPARDRIVVESGATGSLGKPRAPVRRVLFFGKSMSRSRCTGGLVDALERHGLEVKWVNMATLRRWLGKDRAHRRAESLFNSYSPDLVFVFCRDLPLTLLREFQCKAPVVVWVEEPLDDVDAGMVEYLKHGDLVCLSNPGRREWLESEGVSRCVPMMSGFSPRFHSPRSHSRPTRDVVFVGGPGRNGQRARFLSEISRHVDTEIFGFGLAWERWKRRYPNLRVCGPVNNQGFRRICSTSRIVLGLNEINDDPLYFSNRTFLTLACKGFHLTHYVPGLESVFDDGEHLAWYRDADECLDKIRYYLKADEKRAWIATQGHALVVAKHQYYHRVEQILDLLAKPEYRRPFTGLHRVGDSVCEGLANGVANGESASGG